MLAAAIRRRYGLLVIALLLGGAAPSSANRVGEQPVDLELVLAVDVSSSVDMPEYRLQSEGLAAAFQHPDVIAAIEQLDQGVAVAVVHWASQDKQAVVLDWRLLHDPASLQAFAGQLASLPRAFRWGQTSVGRALSFATLTLVDNPFAGLRRVIDLSGDGDARQRTLPHRARDAAVALGITINGLAVLTDDPLLQTYYRDNVIGGSGAFVVDAADYADIERAMVMKLLRELNPLLAQVEPAR